MNTKLLKRRRMADQFLAGIRDGTTEPERNDIYRLYKKMAQEAMKENDEPQMSLYMFSAQCVAIVSDLLETE